MKKFISGVLVTIGIVSIVTLVLYFSTSPLATAAIITPAATPTQYTTETMLTMSVLVFAALAGVIVFTAFIASLILLFHFQKPSNLPTSRPSSYPLNRARKRYYR